VQLLVAGPDMRIRSAIMVSVVLIAAGAYQLSPLKGACLSHCRSPAQFFSRHWRAGPYGALRLGVLHGAYCVGCCWLLMALLFVGGVMNLALVALLTAVVSAEKLLPNGSLVARCSGVALIAGGVGWALL
jgi:predicted metal-binding membrane protein